VIAHLQAKLTFVSQRSVRVRYASALSTAGSEDQTRVLPMTSIVLSLRPIPLLTGIPAKTDCHPCAWSKCPRAEPSSLSLLPRCDLPWLPRTCGPWRRYAPEERTPYRLPSSLQLLEVGHVVVVGTVEREAFGDFTPVAIAVWAVG